jgi:uncharacterized protein (TIGR00251 family)
MRIIKLKVKPNARAAELSQQSDGTWLAKVKAPPVDGKANEALIELVAEHFGVKRSQVSIKSGAAARLKLIQIDEQL